MLRALSFALSISLSSLVFDGAAHASDLRQLEALYAQNFDAYYEPRFCGRNIERLARAAFQHGIDLRGAYALKIQGAGFLETSGFYTREAKNERALLGYFHVVLVADGKVFDFDLHDPLVLDLADYVRLQFSPPREPYRVLGIQYDARAELEWWTATRYELVRGTGLAPQSTWKKRLGELVDLDVALDGRRIR